MSATDSDVCTAVGWSSAGELLTCGDDQAIYVWSKNGESVKVFFSSSCPSCPLIFILCSTHSRPLLQKVFDFDKPITSLDWFPAVSKKQGGNPDAFAVACADGFCL